MTAENISGPRALAPLSVSEVRLMKKHLEEELLATINRFEGATGVGVIQINIEQHDATSWDEPQTAEMLYVVLDI